MARTVILFASLLFVGLLSGVALLVWLVYSPVGMSPAFYVETMQRAIRILTDGEGFDVSPSFVILRQNALVKWSDKWSRSPLSSCRNETGLSGVSLTRRLCGLAPTGGPIERLTPMPLVATDEVVAISILHGCFCMKEERLAAGLRFIGFKIMTSRKGMGSVKEIRKRRGSVHPFVNRTRSLRRCLTPPRPTRQIRSPRTKCPT